LPFHVPGTTWHQRVEPAIAALAGHGADVIVVGHSLAGAYGALVPLMHPVAAVVHLCPAPSGLFYREDAPMRATRPGFPWPAEDARGVGSWDAGSARATLYSRLAPAVADRLVGQLREGAGSPEDPYPLTVHPPVPRRLIYAAEDEFFEPDWERWIARTVLEVEPVELPGGHFPMAEDPEGLADVLTS
jgi:pimeloyl-ACP methyl ester carboxylesterase